MIGVTAQEIAHRSGLWINATESMPGGVYRVFSGPIIRGAYVLVCPPPWAASLARERGYVWRGPCSGGTAYFGKEIAAIDGDTVSLDDRGIMVNGVRLAQSAPLAWDTRGRALPVLRGHWVLGAGEVWLFAGWNERSFDSRYFGPVSVRAVRARVVPLLRWSDVLK